jgi:hypothetical protein
LETGVTIPVLLGLVETQRHSPVAKEASPAKDVSPVVATAKADTKKIKHYKPKVLARQQNNYGYGNALGYAEESGYGPRVSFSTDPALGVTSPLSTALLRRRRGSLGCCA